MSKFDDRRKQLGLGASNESAFERRRRELNMGQPTQKQEAQRASDIVREARNKQSKITSEARNASEKPREVKSFNEIVYGGTNKLKDTLSGNTKKEFKKIVPDIQKVADQRTELSRLGMASTLSSRRALDVEQDAREEATGRNIPVIGTALRGLDKFAEVTKPFADVAQELYTPGGSIGAINTASKSIGTALAKYVPRIGLGTGAGAKTVAKVIEGAPIGFIETAGQSLAHTQDLREAAKQGAYGAGIGAALPLAVPGGKWLVKSAREVLGGSRSGAVDSVVRDVPEATQAVRGAVDDVPASSVPEQVKPMPENQTSAPVQQLTTNQKDALAFIRANPTATTHEIQGKFKLGYVDIQNLKEMSPSASEVAATGTQGIRRNFANQLDNGNYSPELQQRIRDTDQRYDIQTNQASVDAADEALKDMSAATAKFLNNESGGAEHIATGIKLQQRLDSLGKYEEALAVSKKLAEDLTKSGQTSQAAAILERLSPEGQLLNLIRRAEKNGKTVTVADSAAYKDLAAKAQDNAGAGIRENQYTAILNKLERGESVSREEFKVLDDYLSNARKVIEPAEPAKVVKVVDDLPTEFKDVKKRDKIISFLDDAEQAALARIAARKNRLNALPLDEWADHAIVVSAQLAKGTIKAATHVEDLVKLFGEEIRPVATQVFQKAQGLVKGVSRRAGEGDLDRAKQVLKHASGQIAAEKAVVEEMAKQVKAVIGNAKKGKVDAEDLQKMRDYADEIAEMLGDGPPRKFPTKEERYFQTIKSLSKKMADVEKKATPPSTKDQKEIEGLLRQISNLKEGDMPTKAKVEINVKALSDVAHDLLDKPRPLPKVRKTPTKEVVAANKKLVEKLANNVKNVIEQAKKGKIDEKALQTIRDNSAAVAKTAGVSKIQTPDQKFLQSVKSLAKKVSNVETVKVPAPQLNREVEGLLRNVAKLQEEGIVKPVQKSLDNNALSNIAHDLLKKTRPAPITPKTLQEKIVEKYLKENPKVSQKDIDSLRDLAKNITRLSGDAKIDADIAMQKILNSYEKSSVWDKLQSIRYMGMLLNTHTQMINAASGPIMATTGAVVDVFGTMVDIAMNAVLKTPRSTTLYGTNPLRFMAGWMKNLKTGAKAGAVGANPAGIQNTGEIRGLSHKSLYNPFGLAERTLGAVSKGPDYGTYKTVFSSEMEKQGFVSALNSGIKRSNKSAIKEHIRQFVNDPPEEAILQSDRIGKDATFQRSDTLGGQTANWLNSGEGKVKKFIRPVTSAIVPFVRTPINMAETAVMMTPAGVIKGLFQLIGKSDAVSQREAIRTLSLGVMGSAGLGSIGYYLEQIGIMTGANDSGNKDVDNIREQAGRGKYRFNTSALSRYLGAMVNGDGWEAAEKAAKYQEGDKQFDYNKLQPLAFPMAIGASLSEHRDKPLLNRLGKSGEDAFGSLFGMSTLKSVQNIFQPSYGGTQGEKSMGTPYRIAESFFKSFSPGALAQEARRQDPIQRKTPFNDGPIKNTTEYFKSRIPGMSQSLPARKTTLGQDYLNAPGIKGSYFNPYRSEVAPYNKAAEIITGLIDRTGDMGLAPSVPLKSVSGKNGQGVHVSFNIEAKRYAKLQEDVGNEIVKRITALPKYADAKLAEEIENIYTEVRKEKMNEVKKELGIVVY